MKAGFLLHSAMPIVKNDYASEFVTSACPDKSHQPGILNSWYLSIVILEAWKSNQNASRVHIFSWHADGCHLGESSQDVFVPPAASSHKDTNTIRLEFTLLSRCQFQTTISIRS